MREFDKIFLEFPLSCLSYPNQKMESILAFCIFNEARKIKLINKRITENISEQFLPEDFDENDTWCLLITIAVFKLRLKIKSYLKVKELASEMNMFLNDRRMKYGDDAYCRVGKTLFLETIKKRFDYKSFAVLCAISSVLGLKSKYKRVTKETIAYRMMGYKSRDVFQMEKRMEEKQLSRRQIERMINQLHAKGFFGKFTYAKRISFYSTKLNDEQLRRVIFDRKLSIEKCKLKNEDDKFTMLIKNQITLLRRQHKLKWCTAGADESLLN